MTARMRIAVLMGGDSPERDVSLMSGRAVARALEEGLPTLPRPCPGGIEFAHPDFALMCARTGLGAGTRAWFYTSTALREICDIWDEHGSGLTNMHGSTGDIILLGTTTDELEPTFAALTAKGFDLGGSGSAMRTRASSTRARTAAAVSSSASRSSSKKIWRARTCSGDA